MNCKRPKGDSLKSSSVGILHLSSVVDNVCNDLVVFFSDQGKFLYELRAFSYFMDYEMLVGARLKQVPKCLASHTLNTVIVLRLFLSNQHKRL